MSTPMKDLSGWGRSPVVRAEERLSEDAEWNVPELALEIQEISAIDVDLDITVTGFETAEIDAGVPRAWPNRGAYCRG